MHKESLQYKESRKVFYVGCLMMVWYLINQLSKLPDTEAESALEDILAEAEEFLSRTPEQTH
jgi:hypothetical protein